MTDPLPATLQLNEKFVKDVFTAIAKVADLNIIINGIILEAEPLLKGAHPKTAQAIENIQITRTAIDTNFKAVEGIFNNLVKSDEKLQELENHPQIIEALTPKDENDII